VFSVCCDESESALDLVGVVNNMGPYIAGTEEGKILPFANDWGGSYFCFDLTKKSEDGEYPVLFWNHEYSEEPEDEPYLWSEFAHTFAHFVERVLED